VRAFSFCPSGTRLSGLARPHARRPEAPAASTQQCGRGRGPLGVRTRPRPRHPSPDPHAGSPRPSEEWPLHPRGGGKTPLPARFGEGVLDQLPCLAKGVSRSMANGRVGASPPRGRRSLQAPCAGAHQPADGHRGTGKKEQPSRSDERKRVAYPGGNEEASTQLKKESRPRGKEQGTLTQ
jgi:hypothetical protein